MIRFLHTCYTILLSVSLFATADQGLHVEYFDGTNLEKLVTTRTEYKIDRFWNEVPPVDGINPHECSIRWTGKLAPGRTGTYSFSARVDDGIRVWVGDQLIIDDWQLNDVGRFEGKVKLKKGHEYDLKVEYFNALHEGEITLLWKIPPKEERWYHRWFGGEYEVIGPQYFRLPEGNIKTAEVEIYEEAANKPRVLPQPTINKKEEQKISAPSVAPPKVSKDTKTSPVVVKEPTDVPVILSEKVVEKYIPKNIEFEHAAVNILEDSFEELDHFAKFMLTHPQLDVLIEGHTDVMGDAAINKKLSERRAYAVASYLVKKGVSAKRISAEGFGGTKPLVQPEPGKYFPANRRVEFILSGLEE